MKDNDFSKLKPVDVKAMKDIADVIHVSDDRMTLTEIFNQSLDNTSYTKRQIFDYIALMIKFGIIELFHGMHMSSDDIFYDYTGWWLSEFGKYTLIDCFRSSEEQAE